jgi:tripeptidyl-peptidase-1
LEVGDVGDKTEGANHVEAMLDVDVITGVAGNVNTEFWGFDNPRYDNDPFVQWIIKVSTTCDSVIPKVFSTSYGEDENGYPKSIADRYNVEFMKMGLRGISVFFASGDEGANLVGQSFLAEWPASSPYVTAVGAAAPTAGFPQPGSETATALSSGGFSNYFPMPSWQEKAVQAYIASEANVVADFTSLYHVNTTGRAYPDIAAQGYSFCVTPDYVDGVYGCGVGGTSAASPTSAGIFSLLNDLRAQHGKSPLGFLNPLIYRYPEAFQDISIGYNTLNGSCVSPPAWPASMGWDAVTGTGSPNYAKLAAIVSKLP